MSVPQSPRHLDHLSWRNRCAPSSMTYQAPSTLFMLLLSAERASVDNFYTVKPSFQDNYPCFLTKHDCVSLPSSSIYRGVPLAARPKLCLSMGVEQQHANPTKSASSVSSKRLIQYGRMPLSSTLLGQPDFTNVYTLARTGSCPIASLMYFTRTGILSYCSV